VCIRTATEPPEPLLLEGSDDDVVGVDEGLTYDVFIHDDVYISPIQAWIMESRVGACPSWHDCCVLSHLQEHISNFSLACYPLP
jgi:hypothetical protein